MAELLGDHFVCVPQVGGYYHPLAAVYRLSVAVAVGQLLAEGRLRPVFLFETVPTRVVGPEELSDADPELQTLRNLNTPEDYEAALRDVGSAP
jgi:molybdopterin-guanine dinucleotide biosynthesis protein A